MTKKNAISEFHFIMKYIAKLFIHTDEKNFIGIVYLKAIIIMEKDVFINKQKKKHQQTFRTQKKGVNRRKFIS